MRVSLRRRKPERFACQALIATVDQDLSVESASSFAPLKRVLRNCRTRQSAATLRITALEKGGVKISRERKVDAAVRNYNEVVSVVKIRDETRVLVEISTSSSDPAEPGADVDLLDLIVLAAGRGTRAGGPVPKQFLELAGKPVIIHAMSSFEGLPFVGKKIVTAHHNERTFVEDLFQEHKISNFEVVCGGDTRQESVRLALERVQTERVMTHNAALPFVTPRLIANVVRENYPCVTTTTPMEYCLCTGDDFAEEIVPHQRLKLINTPQSFHSKAFRECHQKACEDRVTVSSDCELMMRFGYPVKFVEGDPRNFKITTALDVLLAKSLAKELAAEGG